MQYKEPKEFIAQLVKEKEVKKSVLFEELNNELKITQKRINIEHYS